MSTFCVHCKTKTNCEGCMMKMCKNDKLLISSKCPNCQKVKTIFTKGFDNVNVRSERYLF